MGNYDGDPTSFPATAVLPDDGNADDASHLNPGVETALDRTAMLGRNLMPSGRTPFYSGVAVPNDLTAITGMVNKETRRVIGYGDYVYNSGASGTSDGLYQVDGHGGVGRWQHVEHANFGPRLVKRETKFYQGNQIPIINGGGDCTDPGNRSSGHAVSVGQRVLTSSTFVARAGDVFLISYSLPFQISATGTGKAISDPVAGVGYSASGAGILTYPDELLDNSWQDLPDVDLVARQHGTDWVVDDSAQGSNFIINVYRGAFTRMAHISPGVDGNLKFSLVAGTFHYAYGTDNASVGALQGASLYIEQSRDIII